MWEITGIFIRAWIIFGFFLDDHPDEKKQPDVLWMMWESYEKTSAKTGMVNCWFDDKL